MDCNFNPFSIPLNASVFPIPTPTFIWVPCVVDPITQEFQPLYSYVEFSENISATLPRNQEREVGILSFRRDEWTRDEDLALFRHVVLQGPKAWSRIARELNLRFHGSRNVRVGKHCRGRWYNHLDPNIKSKSYSEESWSTAEDLQLLQLQASIGNSWSLISKKLVGRNENSVKNRWNSLLKQARLNFSQIDSDEVLAAMMLRDLTEKSVGVLSNDRPEVDSFGNSEDS